MAQHILTILAVQDLERAVAFYDAAFGWPKRVEVPVYVEYAPPSGPSVGLYAREAFARNIGVAPPPRPVGATTATELYLRCDELEGDIARMNAAGARLLSPLAPRDWGDEAAYFVDPDGNVLVLARSLAP